jgi:subtilisin family serine protease
MKLRPLTSAVLFALTVAAASSALADDIRRSYIIQLADKPVATYTGDVAGLEATKPPAGQRLNVDASTVQNYINYLETKKASVIGIVSQAKITNNYNVVFNGFSAMLTDAEVRALKKSAGVVNITADSIMKLDTSYTPTFLGLNKSGGLWEQLGGEGKAGENIIIGIVDGGIWPEHDSFADRVDENGNPTRSGSKLAYTAPPASWKGGCQVGEGISASDCNNKLIGAKYFRNSTAALHWSEFLSARDSVGGSSGEGGHGDHTASTAGGNAGVTAYASGVSLGKMSGMAPRARIAAYKVCWTEAATGDNGCATSNSVAAIEQAVKDGVNVINFSIGPNAGGGAFNEATEVAFLGAASAGVFVAASAGNSGPTSTAPAPVAHISPWLTTVGNSTHNRLYVGDAILGNGVTVSGASGNANTPSSKLILAKDAGLAGVDPTNPALSQCFGPADTTAPAQLLDPAKVEGKILVCDRGNNVLVNKSANAKTAGAVGVIIANVNGGAATILNQAHSVSTVHITAEDGTKVKAYIAANSEATAALGNLRGILDPTVQAPIMNGSSSRGPNVANPNIMKPDLTAPGTDILAAVSADITRAQRDAIAAGSPATAKDFAFYTGTSMASPHVAGVAALLKQRYPTWTPAMIKSALMTTAYNTFGDGLKGSVAWDATALTTGTLPWGQGAGHIDPSAAADPGLVYDATEIDYARFLCGLNAGVYSAATCSAIGTIPAYNLNLPSLTAASVLGAQTLTRTVTNVSGADATYTATAALPGYTVEVTPATLAVKAGAKASFTVRLTRVDAPQNTWAYGQLVWSDNKHVVRSPLIARGSSLSAPATVYSEAITGSKVISIGTGYNGAMTVSKGGLIAATQTERSVTPANTSANNTQVCYDGGGAGVNVHDFTVPAGTSAVRFALFDTDTGDTKGNSDLDLVVLRGTTVVGTSGNGTSNEMVTAANPVAGTYRVCVVGYDPEQGSAKYKLSSWIVNPAVASTNLKATAPSAVSLGGTASVTVSWGNLVAGKRYLGTVGYLNGSSLLGTTVLDVDTTDPLPQFNNSTNKVVNVD